MNINEIFEEYDTNIVCVSDLGIQYRGARVDYITQDEHGSVQIWGGHPDDKYSEEFLPTKEERKLIYEQILEEM